MGFSLARAQAKASPGGHYRGAPEFAATLELFGHRPALIAEDGTTLSYRDLARRADAFAADLGPVRRLVLIEASNCVEAIVAYLGALRGGHPVILSAEGARAKDARLADIYAPDAVFARRGDDWVLRLGRPRHDLNPELALLLSTSGSTGATKLVRLAGSAIAANAGAIVEYLGIGPADRAITSLPIHYSYGLSVVNSHLAAGAALVLTDRSVVEPEFWTLAAAQRVTSLAGVPYTYELLDRVGLEGRAPPTLRTLTQAGGRMPPERVERYAAWCAARQARLFVMYGQTEASARMAYLPPDRLASHPGSIGVPVPGGRFDLLDENGASVADGAEGELVYTGPNVMMGYATAATDLARGAEVTSLRTGDLAVRDADGLYRITGRKSRFVKPFGMRVSLDEIEAWLGSRGVDALAAGADDLIAVAFRGDHDARAVTAEAAARFGLPATLFDAVRVDEFPYLATGKRDLQAVLAAARERRSAVDTGGESLAAAISALLHRPVTAGDTFIALAGDSLSYVSAATEIDRRLGYVPDGWEQMSIAALEALATQAVPPAQTWLKPIDSEIVVRAMAIMAVVLTHSKLKLLGGGSDALMILAGFSLARFNYQRLASGRGRAVLASLGQRVVLPYYVLMLGYALVNRNPGWPSFLMVSGFVGRADSFLTPYWFVEALAQATLIVAALFSLPAVRRFAAARPEAFGWLFLGGAIAARAAAFVAFDHSSLNNHSVDSILPLFALGWVMFFARTPAARLACVAAAVLLAASNASVFGLDQVFGGWVFEVGARRALWVMAVPAFLLFAPRIALPRPVAGGLTTVAALSFTIYLTHMLPAHLLSRQNGVSGVITLAVAILLALILDRLVRWLRPAIDDAWARMVRRPVTEAAAPAIV